jgi:predicted outer membrane repeat protein
MKRAILLTIALCLLILNITHAKTYYVNASCGNDQNAGLDPNCQDPNGPTKTIKAALSLALGDDTIIVADGIYTGSENTDITDITFSSNITLKSDNGPDMCIIDCHGTTRAFSFDNHYTDITIDGFSIINGNPGDDGGAIRCDSDSNPTIKNCVFSNNQGQNGGAVFCDSTSMPNITLCSFNANTANNQGGAIYYQDNAYPLISQCDFSLNFASQGGAIACHQSAGIIEDSILTNNTANEGAGIFCFNHSSPLIINCAISANNGTGIFCESSSSPVINYCDINANSGQEASGIRCNDKSSPNVLNSNINRNYADQGGAINLESNSNIRLTNCTLIANTAASEPAGSLQQGGALYCHDSSPTLNNCLIAGNLAAEGAAIFYNPSNQHSAIINNCTITNNNTAFQGGALCNTNAVITNSIIYGNMADHDPEIIPDSSIVINYSNIAGFFGGTGNINADPNFANPGSWYDNQTPGFIDDDIYTDGDYHLASRAGRFDPATENWILDDVTSPCIDAGDPANYCADEPAPNGQRLNMGAFGNTTQASKSSFCVMPIEGDVNGDCKVDFTDFAKMIANWLECNLVPQSDCWN